MSVNLTTIRYYDGDEPYHYTVDNRPLQDLEQNDIALAAAINSLAGNSSILVAEGVWSSLNTNGINISTLSELGKGFAYQIFIWATQDKTLTTDQVTFFKSDVVMGNVSLAGVTSVQTAAIAVNPVRLGSPNTFNVSYSTNGSNLVITPTGFSGNNGYMKIRIDRYGI